MVAKDKTLANEVCGNRWLNPITNGERISRKGNHGYKRPNHNKRVLHPRDGNRRDHESASDGLAITARHGNWDRETAAGFGNRMLLVVSCKTKARRYGNGRQLHTEASLLTWQVPAILRSCLQHGLGRGTSVASALPFPEMG